MKRPEMHCHNELIQDLSYQGFIPYSTMLQWFNDDYSTSKHLLTLYSMVRGLKAKTIIEVGFGRSSFVLARAAYENGGSFVTCDINDFSYLLNEEEKKVTKFINGDVSEVWKICKQGIDFAFFDFFSVSSLPKSFSVQHITECIKRMKQNAILAIHDSIDSRFKLKSALIDIFDKNIEILNLPYNGLVILKNTKGKDYENC